MTEPLSLDATLKDWYPRPGTRYKQYVVDTMRENQWELETAPSFHVDLHERAGCPLHVDPGCDHCKVLTRFCGHSGPTSFLALRYEHTEGECPVCCEAYQRALGAPSVIAWLAEKAKRPPICEDRKKYSDQIVPDFSLAENPLFAMVPKR